MQRIVRQNPNGIDENEVAGIDAFEQSLPDNWLGYANYELRDPREPLVRQREIDVILVTHNRVLLIDLKNWRGKITNVNGHWAQHGTHGGQVLREPSPILKLSKNAKKMATLMRKNLSFSDIPTVEHFVVMSAPQADFSELPDSELARTMSLMGFIAMLRNANDYDQRFPDRNIWSRQRPFCAMRRQLDKFFQIGRNFEAQKLWFADAYPVTDKPQYSHPSRIYEEYNVTRYDNPAILALLRVWDFSRLPAKASAPAFRQEIAKREMNVLSRIELNDNELYRDGVLISETRDEFVSMRYWEIFRRNRSMSRLRDVIARRSATKQQRFDAARILLSRIVRLHRLGIAHTDISQSSVWIDFERNSVLLSNFGAAHFPEVESLRNFREVLAAAEVPIPEDLESGNASALFARDVYLAATVLWPLLTDLDLSLSPSLEFKAAGIQDLDMPPLQKSWFLKALAPDRASRFSSAKEALAAFVHATDAGPIDLANRRLNAFRRDEEPYLRYPVRRAADVLKLGNSQVWIHETDDDSKFVVKMWPNRGIKAEERASSVLAFLDRVNMLWATPFSWVPQIVDFGLTEMCLYVVEQAIDVDDLHRVPVESLPLEQTAAIIKKLVAAVEALHQLGIAHGDLKPEHVKAGTRENDVVVFLIDLHDFQEDGRRAANSAYAAPSDDADAQTDDRYAVCKMIGDLAKRLSKSQPEFSARIGLAANRCGNIDYAWRSFAPLTIALDRYVRNASKRRSLRILVAESKLAEPTLLEPNGDMIYAVRQSENRVTFVGNNRKIQLNLEEDADLSISTTSTGDLDWARREGQQFEIDITMIPGSPYIGEVRALFGKGLLKYETTTDKATEQNVSLESTSIGRVSIQHNLGDVSRLWKEAIAVEIEQRTSVVANGTPYFDEALSLHFIPCGDFQGANLEMDGVDVEVKKQGKVVALLDPYYTQPGYLAVRDLRRVDAVRENDRLTLESVLQAEDLRRRSAAVSRVLDDEAVIPGLKYYFDPSYQSKPIVNLRDVPEDSDMSVYGLNEGQKEAFLILWKNRPLGLLQGPPGTGKTDFIAAFVHYAITKTNVCSALVLSQSHEAANAVTTRIRQVSAKHEAFLSMLRFGAVERVSDGILSIHAGAIQNGYRETFVATLPIRILGFAKRLGLDTSYAEGAFEIGRNLRGLMYSAPLVNLDRSITIGDINVPPLIAFMDRFGIPTDTTLGDLKVTAYRVLIERTRVTNPASAEAFNRLLDLSWDWDSALQGGSRTLESFLAKTRSVVCGTCVGAGKRRLGIDSQTYDLVVVDEAARCGPGELAVAIQSAKWVILVGDHKQLPPTMNPGVVKELRKRLGQPEEVILTSDFHRVFQSPYGLETSATLKTQYRMAPVIRQLVSALFYQEEQLEDGRGEPPACYEHLAAPFDAEVSWYDTSDLGDDAFEHRVGDSYNNVLEARIILNLLRSISDKRSFWDAAPEDVNIGVICMYAEQRRTVREVLQSSGLPDAFIKRVKVDTVDGYQGQQNDIVIVSLVRNNSGGQLGFVRDERRANVALSRARERLVIVGAARFFEGTHVHGNPFSGIPAYLRNLPGLGDRVKPARTPGIRYD